MKATTKGWVMALLGALFFFYAFMQANLMASFSCELLRSYNANACSLSLFTAAFFYGNIIFVLPAGLLLDRYSPKMLMIAGVLLAIAGTLIFGVSNSLFFGSLGRFLCGIMMALGLIGPLKLASLWLPPSKMALASSLIITIGMFGGIFAQAPVAMLIGLLGWRGALMAIAFFGVFVALVIALFIKVPKLEKTEKEAMKLGVFNSLKEVAKRPQNWLTGFFICLLNQPIALLGALFGTPYLMQAHGFLPLEASFITSMLFFGMILGSPFFGWFSDYMKLRKMPMYVGSITCFFLVLILLFGPKLGSMSAHVLFFLIGFTSAAQVLGYPVISESNPQKITGTALSLASLIIMGVGYGLALPFVGWLLDLSWSGEVINGVNIYTASAYQKALLSIPIAILLSVFMLFFTKETKCRSL